MQLRPVHLLGAENLLRKAIPDQNKVQAVYNNVPTLSRDEGTAFRCLSLQYCVLGPTTGGVDLTTGVEVAE